MRGWAYPQLGAAASSDINPAQRGDGQTTIRLSRCSNLIVWPSLLAASFAKLISTPTVSNFVMVMNN